MNPEGIEIEILLDYNSDDDEDFKARQGKKLLFYKGIIPWVKNYNLVMKYIVPAIHN